MSNKKETGPDFFTILDSFVDELIASGIQKKNPSLKKQKQKQEKNGERV
ncbi:hypothetical protein FACS189447_01680 [Spirochaetia bacterium]|nr:hypothetical protein FACS189447_01680 [Spirochaetia bacterium]